jgi:hypothetical protein
MHNALKVELEELGLLFREDPEADLHPPFPAIEHETVRNNPGYLARVLAPEGDSPGNEEVLSLNALAEEMVE